MYFPPVLCKRLSISNEPTSKAAQTTAVPIILVITGVHTQPQHQCQ